MATRLFIENQEVELDKSVQFAITKQFEDLSNPTTIINDWSKTVSIPFTQKNNNLFGNIYKTDRLIVTDGTDKNTGIYFNPTLKMDFRLQDGDNVLMTGYAKMNEIKQKDGKGTYEITLFGELGKIFQELKKITFDTTTTEQDYLISGSTWVDEKINKDLVYNSWTSSGQTQSKLFPKWYTPTGSNTTIIHPAYKVTDIIGFAPNNSFGEDFKYDTFQSGDKESKTFEDVLGTGFTADTGIEPKTVIPNGMLPREIGEYRSYQQLPFIYWNKLFQIFQSKAESITGYQFELDSSWFNTSNPYWYNLVYMLKSLNNIKNNTFTNVYTSGNTNTVLTTPVDSTKAYRYDFSASSDALNFTTNIEQFPVLQSNNKHFLFDGEECTKGDVALQISMSVSTNLSSTDTLKIRNNSVFVVDVFATDGTQNIMIGRISIKSSESSYIPQYSTHVVDIDSSSIPSGSWSWTFFNNIFTFNVPSSIFNGNVYFYYKVSGNNSELSSATMFVNSNSSSIQLGNITTTVRTQNMNLSIIPLQGKSFSNFTLNTLWNNDYNLFEEIIRYCKIYHISISVDEVNKKIIFKPFNKYFENYTVLDWTDIVDKSKDYTITPITFENKYVLFDYKDSETQLGKDYKEKYGVNYGEYRLISDYNFNTDTKKLFENIPQSITNTDNVLSWTNIYDNHKVTYSFPSEIFICNKNKEKKQVDIFGSYFFHNGLATFSTETELNLRSVKISDDTIFQQKNNTYFYAQSEGDIIGITTYPWLDIVSGNNMCVFNIPKENYTYLHNYTGKNTIYTNFWEKYINERYNIQNKKITCYVKLKPIEYIQFRWNHFVKIGNQLYMVNKIYDYDISNNQPTKVDLITIQDVTGYTN